MLLSEFDFKLPEGLIATHPVDPRDSARLMVASRDSGKITHSSFHNLPSFLQKGDFLVFNSSKVIPARLFGKVNGKDIEILLISQFSVIPAQAGIYTNRDSRLRGNDSLWKVLAKPGKRLQKGSEVIFNKHLSARVVDITGGIFRLKFSLSNNDFWREIGKVGEMPLPPYILKARHEQHDEQVDISDYQTVYADKAGSVAAPTAGLHFTEDLMQRVKDKGCDIGFVDLHVGLGTFEPIRTERVEDHKIHSEYFELSNDLADTLNQAKKEGRRIIAVGTTTVRVLESCCENGSVKAKYGETDIYIYPGYEFGFVDGMITNFHLPKSSLLLLVSALWSWEKILETYQEAIQNNYRFYSYGDGMLII